MRLRSPKLRGFSLIEMLIVCTIFSLVTAVVAVLFTQGTYTYRHGASHLELQRGGRALSQRIAPFAASMINSDYPTATPLRKNVDTSGGITLANMGKGDEATEVIFLTTEDWLGPNYPSGPNPPTNLFATSSTEIDNVSELDTYYYRIRYDDPSTTTTGDGQILLERLIVNEAADPMTATVDPDGTRTLYREKDEAIRDFSFRVVRSTLLQLRFAMESQTRSAANQLQTTREEFRMTFNIPTQTL